MSDLPDPMAPQGADPLADLKTQIETEIAHGKFNEEQLAELREIQLEHAHGVAEIVTGHEADAQAITDAVREDARAWSDEHPDFIASHDVEPRDMADLMQPLDVAAIDQVEGRIDALSERVELELDTWRDIVEWRAEQGGESPEVVDAQLAQIDAAEEHYAHAHDHYHESFDSARQAEDTVMDDVRETNLPPTPTTIDAGDYHLSPGEHDVPTEA